jgi:hypothetical protein
MPGGRSSRADNPEPALGWGPDVATHHRINGTTSAAAH